jgi:uridine kinase
LKLFFEIKTDVEAAAELGRTLLERNRELESTVRQQQAVIDDQTQEMEVMKIKHM